MSTNDTQSGTSSINSLHNIPEKDVKSTSDSSVAARDSVKPSSVIRDAQGKVLPGSLLNPEGKNASLSQILREKGDKPCAYVPGMTWAQAIVENEWSQALTDPIARKHLLDRLLGRATESIDMRQSGEIILRVVHDDYVNPNEPKQIENNLTISKTDTDSAPMETEPTEEIGEGRAR